MSTKFMGIKPTKLTKKDIVAKESMVRGRQSRSKQARTSLPANELVLLNYKQVPNQNEIFNLIKNKIDAEIQTKKAGQNIIYYFDTTKKAISMGKQLNRAFKGSKIKISLSKVNKEVKVYIDFNISK